MAEEDTAEKEQDNSRLKEIIKKHSKNYWAVSTVILGVLLVIVLFANITGFAITGATIGSNEAGEKVLEFAKLQGYDAELVEVNKNKGLTEVVISMQGQEFPIYLTKEGYMISNPVTIQEMIEQISSVQKEPQTQQQEISKTNKPKAEFFVFSYCPYGTQMEKALIPIYNLLKNKADISIVFIGAMHGEYEKTESLRQLCMQKEYGKDKLFSYLEKFLADTKIGNCQGGEACLTPLINSIYSQLGISSDKINNCMKTDAEALYNADISRADELGISGSPTVVINNVKAQVGRSPALVQEAICSAFNTSPAECNQVLSSETASPGFGISSSSSTAGSCG